MFQSFRAAMTWLHTWFGLVIGFVLMVVFFFGTLSVFDREIDRWAIPETRFEPQRMPSYDAMLAPIFARIVPDRAELEAACERVQCPPGVALPVMSYSAYTTHRDPVLSLYSEFSVNNPEDPHDHVHGHLTVDPRSGAVLPHDPLKIGSEFFYPLHYSLHLGWRDLGYWLVGLAALTMLVALVSGVVIHRKLFREFFTFRPAKNTQRSVLDLHNLTGVVALPFHFMFPLTGLFIFAGIYFPVASTEPLRAVAEAHARAEAAAKSLPFSPAGVAAKLAPVDPMVEEAKRRWAARGIPGDVGWITVNHVGDANSYVSVHRAGSDRVSLVGEAVHFAGRTGNVIHEEPPYGAVMGMSEFLVGMHLAHFEHWLLRWLYVVGGLSGSACIATGLVFFVGKRRARHASLGISGARWAEAAAITSITGMLIATFAMLALNRVLPADLADRDTWQKLGFAGAWILAAAHAAWRSAPAQRALLAPAWREQCWAVAFLALAAVTSNWISTGDHLLRTVLRGYWAVAGLDIGLLSSAGSAVFAATRLRRRERRVSSEPKVAEDPAPLSTPAGAVHG